jgi:hypothetical protein
MACQAGSPTKALPPQIKSVSPDYGICGYLVTLVGEGFTGVTRVLFEGRIASFKVKNDKVMQAMVPPDSEPGSITVISPMGQAEYKDFNVVP